MPLPVKLGEVIDALEMVDDSIIPYVNRKTGEVATVSSEEAAWLEGQDPEDAASIEDWPEWQREALAEARRILDGEDFTRLPGKFQINEWSTMQRFAQSLEDEDDSADLLNAIHGRGAFRIFKMLVARMGLREEWFKFRYEALAEIAMEFLEKEHIPYTRGFRAGRA